MYPKAYFQMKAMLNYCHKQRHKVTDKAYIDALMQELKNSIELIESEAQDDDYTGEMDELEGLHA